MITDDVIRNDWHVVYSSAALADGSVAAVRLLGEDLVLWRWKGQAMAWLDLCVHRGSRLTMGRVLNGELVCPYHGWHYDREGQCTLIPAQPNLPIPKRARAITYNCQERYGFIWVCMGEPVGEIPALPEWDNEKFVKVYTGPYEIAASAPRIVENVLDVTHFPFVHDNMLGIEGNPDEVGEYNVRMEADGLWTSPISVYQPVGDHRRTPVHTTYTFWCPRPCIAYLIKEFGEGLCFSHYMPITPVGDGESVLWVLTLANFNKDDAQASITMRNDEIFTQDKPILENQRPSQIPLDLRQELHIRADKLHVAYRRWLNEIGVTTGFS
jgi:phenylpropionate dioxygenase-like ring-hydroxylating dioxygenase large terminal subunit